MKAAWEEKSMREEAALSHLILFKQTKPSNFHSCHLCHYRHKTVKEGRKMANHIKRKKIRVPVNVAAIHWLTFLLVVWHSPIKQTFFNDRIKTGSIWWHLS